MSEKNCTIVTITDRNFLIPVFILILSLRFHKHKNPINVLTVSLSDEEKTYLSQFENVQIFCGDPGNYRNPATRKGEAILTAENDASEFVALFDGDCIVTGNISKYLTPNPPGWYLRQRLSSENIGYFSCAPSSSSIPSEILEAWKKDVGERDSSRMNLTYLSGNVVLHKKFIGFAKKWDWQIKQVLPQVDRGSAHDRENVVYQHLDESVLNSLVCFSEEVPPIYDYQLDKDPNAFLAHLGPFPKYWRIWPKKHLVHYESVMGLLDWAQTIGVNLPPLPPTLKRGNRLRTHIHSIGFEYFLQVKRVVRSLI